MCSEFLERIMDDDNNYDQGDLADIFRAVNGTTSGDLPDWQFQSDPILSCPTNTLIQNETINSFGHPFNRLGDPLLERLGPGPGIGTGTRTGTRPSSFLMMSSSSSNLCQSTDHHEEEKIKIKPSQNINLFSRMLQISPTSVKLPLSSSRHGNIENNSLQISSPRNTGIKRRKSQAKKVVCIPAPAPANSRPTGEVVPSDLWAWRKYGQKPIKGSPYPRGYYRCSSSKGCLARKQVERSRTDPNMLVITYTSEHNHPWPTQRNALAGSTRTQPSKSSKNNPPEEQQLNPKEEITNINATAKESSSSKLVKLEDMSMDQQKEIMKMDDGEYNTSEGFSNSYKPALPTAEANHHAEDFFADLGEIEVDPLNILFTQGLSGDDQERSASAKDLDPFSFYDWTTTHNNPSSGTG